MLKLYGHFMSMPSNVTRLCVSYLKLPHEYVHVDLQSGENQGAEYLAINPAGRVPAMVDDGFNLNQSIAICKYMCAISGPSDFYPEDIQEQAKVEEWLNFAGSHILPGMGRIFFNKVVAPLLGEETDESSIATGQKMHARDLPVFEAALQAHAYVVADKLTLADIILLAALEPAEMVGLDLSVYPAISKWRKALMERDFYQRVHAHFAAEMAG